MEDEDQPCAEDEVRKVCSRDEVSSISSIQETKDEGSSEQALVVGRDLCVHNVFRVNASLLESRPSIAQC